MGDDIGLGDRRAWRLDRVDTHRLAALLVGDADAGALGDAVAGGYGGLDLVRVDVEARDQDHVLLAVDDLDEPVLGEDADVAGAEEAVGR